MSVPRSLLVALLTFAAGAAAGASLPATPTITPLRVMTYDIRSGNGDLAGTAAAIYPTEKPAERIDCVLVSPQFSVKSIRVPVTEASDHRSVVAELVMH